ncbi:MAG: hypothetical protein H6806_08260 [Planctomycetes bacterium]|nr:hypothetical protein [Planctomycetota bacterium]MCB9829738.1 hypothetical protein [Planctomycetota bacterium]MCB9902350.1 hypothetical protein [Planctomycetota bacterium]
MLTMIRSGLCRPRPLGVALLAAAGLALGGCGHHRHHEGDILVDNRTDLTTSEDLLTFRIARFGQDFTSDLLGGSLPPASARFIGTFREDYYDGTGDLSGGGIIDWQDLYVGYERTTVFEVR